MALFSLICSNFLHLIFFRTSQSQPRVEKTAETFFQHYFQTGVCFHTRPLILIQFSTYSMSPANHMPASNTHAFWLTVCGREEGIDVFGFHIRYSERGLSPLFSNYVERPFRFRPKDRYFNHL